jgi:LPS-assembly protein
LSRHVPPARPPADSRCRGQWFGRAGRVVSCLLATCWPFLAGAAAEPPRLEADSVTGSMEADGTAVARGHAVLRDGTLLLTAEEIRFERREESFIAAGGVVLTRGAIRLLADRIVYRRADGRFSAERIRIGSPPYFAEAASAEGTLAEITLRQARLSYGEPGRWRPTVVADTIVLAPGQIVRTEGASAGIGHLQPFGLPRLQHELSRPLPVRMELEGGFRRSLGAFGGAQLLLPVSAAASLGGDLAAYTRRGVMIGPAGHYESVDTPGRLHGAFRSGYINDQGDRHSDIHGRPIPEDRAYAEWLHQQRLGERLTLNAQLNWWRDSDVLRDFRPRAFVPVQEPDTFAESVYTGANWFLSAFARFQPNRFQAVQERLPELRFDLLPFALGHGFYHRVNASAAFLRERPPQRTLASTVMLRAPGDAAQTIVPYPWTEGGETLQTTRLDGYYALERPFAPAEWLAITPLAGMRFTHYTRTPRTIYLVRPSLPPRISSTVIDRGSFSRTIGELGVDAVLRSSGTFDYRNPQWKIDGLRHLFTPRLSYRYLPKAGLGRAQIPRFDRESFATYLPPLGLGDVRHLDDLDATNTLRLGCDNVLQTRDATLGSRDLLVVNLANDFRLARRPGERTFSEIHAEVAVNPARWLQLDLYESFASQDATLREFNSGLTVRAGDAWSLRFGNNFLRGQIQDYSFHGRWRLDERFEAVTRLHYDARRRRFTEQTYGVAHNVGNSWLISYMVSVYSGRRRESNFGLDVRVDAIRF